MSFFFLLERCVYLSRHLPVPARTNVIKIGVLPNVRHDFGQTERKGKKNAPCRVGHVLLHPLSPNQLNSPARQHSGGYISPAAPSPVRHHRRNNVRG